MVIQSPLDGQWQVAAHLQTLSLTSPQCLSRAAKEMHACTLKRLLSQPQVLKMQKRRTHVGEAAPAVQGHSSLEAKHGCRSQQGTLSSMHCMVGPGSNCARSLLL